MASESERSVRVTFAVEGLQQRLYLIQFEGKEGISTLFSFEVLVACRSSALDFEQVVDRPAQITLEGRHGARPIHGTVSAVEQLETSHSFTTYRMTLVPAAWRLLHSTDCRIFQHQSIQAIIGKVLDQHSIAHRFRSAGNTPPAEREYCVQYRESDWAFVCRLLEEEGYSYWFEHQDGKHLLQMGNAPAFFADIPGDATLPYHPPGGGEVDADHINAFRIGESVQSGAVTLRDFNFAKPTLNLQSGSGASRFSDLERYDYPGLYHLPAAGKGLAQVRLQEAQAGLRRARGASDCPRLSAGSAFELVDHPREDLNKIIYLASEVLHHTETRSDLHGGALDERVSYDNRFVCVPKAVPFRPARQTHKPFVQGVQTAVVVGPKSEEIYTDEHGRVKVQFHWDRLGKMDENASCWVRVSQVWAGQGWGAMYIPRIGQEVIVDFLEGDPDRPIITGRVYHGQNTPPYTLPGDKTRSTIKSNSTLGGGGSNEIRFEDKKGAEEVYTHAQKDQNEVVENDMSTRVGHDQSVDVGNDQTIAVGHDRDRTVGHDETIAVGHDRTETVQNDEATTIVGNRTETVHKDETITVAGNRTETVHKDETIAVVGNRSETVQQNETVAIVGNRTETVHKDAKLSVSGNQAKTVMGSHKEAVKKTKSLSVRLTSSEMVGLAKSLTVGGAYTLQVGAAMAQTVGAALIQTVMGNLTQSVGKVKKVTVGEKLEIVCGEAKLVLEKGGKVTIEGTEFFFNAPKGPVKINGKVVDIN